MVVKTYDTRYVLYPFYFFYIYIEIPWYDQVSYSYNIYAYSDSEPILWFCISYPMIHRYLSLEMIPISPLWFIDVSVILPKYTLQPPWSIILVTTSFLCSFLKWILNTTIQFHRFYTWANSRNLANRRLSQWDWREPKYLGERSNVRVDESMVYLPLVRLYKFKKVEFF